MKIGRNDPCPCGSGRKYKHCCLNNPKIIPFPENNNIPQIHELMGFDNHEDYNEAFAMYQDFCENVLQDGSAAPTFREFIGAESVLAEVMNNPEVIGKLEKAKSEKEVNSIISGAIDRYNNSEPEGDTIKEALDALWFKGPLKADNAVFINKKVEKNEVINTPLIKIAVSFLEYLARNNGSISVSDKGKFGINMEELVDILLEDNELDLLAKNSRGELLLAVWYKYVNILLDEKGYVKYTGTDIEITEKGLKLLRYTGVKNTYFQFLTYLTEKLDWLFYTNLPEDAQLVQDIAGFALLTINKLSDTEKILDPEDVLKTIDSIYPVFEEMKKSGITKYKTLKIFTDFFFDGYCRLMGFVTPEPLETEKKNGKNKIGYKPTELFFSIFEWKI